MSAQRPFVSVKFTPAGRTVSFLLPDLVIDEFGPGDRVVVDSQEGPAIGTVTRVAHEVAERRQPAENSPQVVLRRATRDDVIQKLKQQQREVEAHRVAQLKIRERRLTMKLTQLH